MTCPDASRLAAWVDDSVIPDEAVRLEAHVAGCASCRTTVAAMRGGTAWLGRLAVRQAVDPAFVAQVRSRLVQRARPCRRWPLALAGVLGALVLVLVARPRPEFVGRGSSPRALSQLLGVEVFAEGASGPTLLRPHENVGQRRLSFVVSNRAQQPMYLALFGLDAAGQSHWFYPAFHGDDAPRSVLIAPTPSQQALPEAVSPDDVAVGPLRIVALFTRRPLDVRHFDAVLAAGGLASGEARFHPEVVQVLEVQAP